MMEKLLQNLLTADLHGSIVILAVLLLRAVLRKTPKKYICFLWMLAGLRLLLPVPLVSSLSLQPLSLNMPSFGRFLPVIAFAYGLLALIILSYSLISYLKLRAQVADAVKIRGGWESDKIETAFVLGFLKPKIYIPAGMTEDQRRQILAHERTHLDKGDHWIKLIGFLALALHWYNPLVWLAYALLCRDMEMACDERVVRFMEPAERKAYSSALLECSTKNVHYAACPVAFGEVSVKYRILSILNYRKPSFWVSLLGVCAVVFVALCLGTNRAAPPEDPEAPLIESSRETPETFTPAVTPELPENPDWGVTPRVDGLTPTGGRMVIAVEERFCQQSETMEIRDSSLEVWKGTAWEEVPSLSDQREVLKLSMGFAQSRAQSKTYEWEDMDWTLNYGSLPAGDYRIKMTIAGDSQSGTFYTPFHIYREALPSQEEAALSRCEKALQALKSNSYSVLIREKNDYNDSLSPRMRLTVDGGSYRIDYYAGEFLASSYTGTEFYSTVQDWDRDFSLNQNRKFLFPEGTSKIEQDEISFCSVWTDTRGTAYQGTDSYRFDEKGNLCIADRLVTTMDGTVVSHKQLESIKDAAWSYIQEAGSYNYNSNTGGFGESPWNIWLRVDDDRLSPKGGDVWTAWEGAGVSDYYIDSCFWLEKKKDGGWERLLGEDVTAPFVPAFRKLSSTTQTQYIDWSGTYGSLRAGVYRMGARFFHGDESMIQYSEFSIRPTGGIFGTGGQEAMARVDAAIEQLKAGSYHTVELNSDPSLSDEAWVTQEYWQCGRELAVDFYNKAGAYSHSVVEQLGDAIMDGWYRYSTSFVEGDPYSSVYFPEGNSVISDDEITFYFSYSSTAGDDPCMKYTYRFDDQGRIVEVCKVYSGRTWGGFVSRCLVDYLPEDQIQAHIDSVRR